MNWAQVVASPMRRLPIILLLLLGAPRAVLGQGGPPMITDDPGTPGNGHWEINLAWTEQRVDGSTLTGLPLLDANYGVGDRIQLNYQASWNIAGESGSATESAMSGSQFAVKWRFYDAGDAGPQVSMYPRLTLPEPHPDEQDRGTPATRASFLMPFEFSRDLGPLSVNLDAGYTYSSLAQGRGWMGGVCLGHEVRKGWEVDGEIHVTASQGLGRSETIVNLGSRYDFNAHATLLLALGRDLSSSLGPRISVLTYVGVQIRL